MLTLFRCACGCYEKWVLDYSRWTQPGSYRCSRSTQQGKELCVFIPMWYVVWNRGCLYSTNSDPDTHKQRINLPVTSEKGWLFWVVLHINLMLNLFSANFIVPGFRWQPRTIYSWDSAGSEGPFSLPALWSTKSTWFIWRQEGMLQALQRMHSSVCVMWLYCFIWFPGSVSSIP